MKNLEMRKRAFMTAMPVIKPVESWADVQRIVRNGETARYFKIGDQFTVNKTVNGNAEQLVFDVIGINHDIPTDARYRRSLTLQLHNYYGTWLIFDAPEATWYIDGDTYPNGIIAGIYNFKLPDGYMEASGGGKTYMFTTAKDVPVGGKIHFYWEANKNAADCNIVTYSSKNAVIESTTVSEGNAGNRLPDVSAAQITYNTNIIQRSQYGSNNWKNSAVRQWLNSDKAANTWWVAQTNFDLPANADLNGFLYGFDADFLSILGKVEKITQKGIFDGYGMDSTSDLFFLLSRSEVYGGAEYPTDGADGSVYAYYGKDRSSLAAPGTGADSNRVKKGVYGAYWHALRTAQASAGHTIRSVEQNGSISNRQSRATERVAPACVIV